MHQFGPELAQRERALQAAEASNERNVFEIVRVLPDHLDIVRLCKPLV